MKKKRQSKLQTRFFAAYLLVAGIILLVFALFFYRYVSKILIEQQTNSLIDLSSSFRTQTDSVVKNMDSVSINLDYSAAIEHLLGNDDLDLSQIDLDEFTALCTTINGVEHKVDQVNLFDYAGNVLQVGTWSKHNTVGQKKPEWIEQVKLSGGSKVLSVPYLTNSMSRYSTGSRWYISLYRCYSNSYGRKVGAIETVKSCKSVFKSIISYRSKSGTTPSTYVYNQDGVLLYPYSVPDNTKFHDYYSILDVKKTHADYYNPDSKQAEIIAYNTSTYTDWTYVTVQPNNVILAPVRALLKLLMIIIAFMLLGCILISYYMSRTLMKPITLLKQEIKRTELATLDKPSQEAWENSYIELEDLNQSFLTMRGDLKTSMDELLETRKQELKSRTMALQSQINPHFYYNSLASVIALAENDQNEEVIQMCHNLTKIMRYITDSQEIVTLADEISYVNKYMYCMKIRYQTSLNYMIDIDERLEAIKMPRLLIQPLVENALKYGMNSEPPWGIAIHAYMGEDNWRIEVMDSGNGFSVEALNTIQERIEKSAKHIGMPQMQINGMGTLNVYLRWKLFCGEDMIFKIGNTESGHGIVTLGCRFKKEEGDKNDR